MDLLDLLQKQPLTKGQFVRCANRLNLTQQEMAYLLGLSLRTFQRKKQSDPISVPSSEAAIKLAEVYSLGLEAFDQDKHRLNLWLSSEIPALANKKPKHLLTSSLGVDLVKEELQRIEYNIYG